MRLSFDDEESFLEAAGSLCFNNHPSDSDSDALQQMENSSSMEPHPEAAEESSEDISFNNPPSNLNTL